MIGTEIHNFNTLYTKFYRKSFLFTKSYVHDECIAEDIVSDVLIKLWEILKEKEIEHIEALLLTTLKNKSLDHLKHEAVKTEALRTLTDMRQGNWISASLRWKHVIPKTYSLPKCSRLSQQL